MYGLPVIAVTLHMIFDVWLFLILPYVLKLIFLLPCPDLNSILIALFFSWPYTVINLRCLHMKKHICYC